MHVALDELRARRDECLAEREYLSLLRRLVQGRAEILQAELEGRGTDDADRASLIERLSTILAGDEQHAVSRGEAVRVGLPEDEMLQARRRVERLVSDAGISDPTELAAAFRAVRALSTAPVIAQMTVGEDGKSTYGADVEHLAAELD